MTYVYVAINPATNPPCIKIGITDDIDKRMKQLSVGQLRRWESLYEYYYSSRWKSKCVERQLHGAFQSRNCKNTRDCSSREMFFASPHHVDYLITHHQPKFEATRLRNGNISYSCSFNGEPYTLDPDGEYLKNSNILKKCYDTINLS